MMVTIDTTHDILDALRNKYKSDEFALLTNVGDSTGFRCKRHADAIVMELWPSRGLEIIGFEIKASRSDWMHELKKPAKADPIAEYCDSWYLVLGDENILKFGELPMGWGLMVPQTKTNLKIVKESNRNLKPKPLDRFFVAALLRRASEQVLPDAKLNRKYDEGFKAGVESQKQTAESNYQWMQKENQQQEKLIKDFEEASGIKLGAWSWAGNDSKKLGEAVKVVLNGSYLKELENLKILRTHAERCLKNIDEEIQKLEPKPVKDEETTSSGQ